MLNCFWPQVLQGPDSSPFIRLMPTRTTCPKPIPGVCHAYMNTNGHTSVENVTFQWLIDSFYFSPLQLQSDWYSTIWELWQAVRQAADRDRGDLWFRRGMRHLLESVWTCVTFFRTYCHCDALPGSLRACVVDQSEIFLFLESQFFSYQHLFKQLLESHPILFLFS